MKTPVLFRRSSTDQENPDTLVFRAHSDIDNTCLKCIQSVVSRCPYCTGSIAILLKLVHISHLFLKQKLKRIKLFHLSNVKAELTTAMKNDMQVASLKRILHAESE